jgi:hypothetical protein
MALAFSQVSCREFLDIYTPLDEGSFWAQNLETERNYKVRAEILAEGRKCVVWAETGCGVTREKAKEIADEYDNIIRLRIVDAFGKKDFYADSRGKEYKEGSAGSKTHFNDILDYANWLVNRNDGKLTILLLDIKDGYKDGDASYVAGYFSPGNLLSTEDYSYSNVRDMIYIDTYPGLRGHNISQTYATLAHELQHLINFVTNYVLLNVRLMDTWIDEGLSAWAEYLYEGGNPVDKCEWFIKGGAKIDEDDPGTIATGNNFFVWGNHTVDTPAAILDDYATVYLFFRWLYLQAEAQNLDRDIFYKIITSPNVDYNAVTDVAKDISPEWASWDKLLGAWLAANSNPKNNNYGYKNDPYLRDKIKVKPVTETSISLYPGEGVYSSLNNRPFTPVQGGDNIRYAGLRSENTSTVIIGGHFQQYNGSTLLTFNAGTSYDDNNPARDREEGELTGRSSILPKMLTDEMQAVEFKGPYVIDARDVLGRNRDKYPFLSPGR